MRSGLSAAVRSRLKAKDAKLQEHLATKTELPDSVANAYREPELKASLAGDTRNKCAYCESKVDHTYYGDVEHILPKTARPELRLTYENLTYSCAICNNSKGEFYDPTTPLVDPFSDDPSSEFFPFGYLLRWRPGRERALLTIDKLQLNRLPLVERRKERIELLMHLGDQFAKAPDGALKDLLREELCNQSAEDKEYTLFTTFYVNQVCGIHC
jgi:uncharacterized protein (TIGR02646 family)